MLLEHVEIKLLHNYINDKAPLLQTSTLYINPSISLLDLMANYIINFVSDLLERTGV